MMVDALFCRRCVNSWKTQDDPACSALFARTLVYREKYGIASAVWCTLIILPVRDFPPIHILEDLVFLVAKSQQLLVDMFPYGHCVLWDGSFWKAQDDPAC